MTYHDTLTQGYVLHGMAYSYHIEHVLGQGSFGITYLASVKIQGALGSIDANVKVAIKEFFMKEFNGREGTTVTSGSKGGLFENYRKKFVREATNLSKLHHPNIIKVLEYFEANNTVYYAMEYLDGGSLDELINKKHGLPNTEAIRYIRQIASALSYMHEHKVLHLDLKPGNIMLHNGNAVLIDFGLSKQYDENGNPESSTTIGGGTPGYAPIEQANYHDGQEFPVTMDVYALGATMFKMLTGKRPPEASYIINEGFPVMELYGHGVSETLCNCVETAMSPKKKDRFQSVDAFVKCLSGMHVSDANKDTQTSRNDEQTTFDGNTWKVGAKKEHYDGLSIFALSKDNHLYCYNSNLCQNFEIKAPLSYDNYYNIYPAKSMARGYGIEDFIRHNRKVLMEPKTLITYKHSDSLVAILRLTDKFSIKPHVIPEVEIIAYGWAGKSQAKDVITCIKTDDDFCIFESVDGVCEIIETNSNALYCSHTTSDLDIARKYKLSPAKSHEFLFKGVLKWMDTFEDIPNSVLLACSPLPIYIGKLQGRGVTHCETFLDGNNTFPLKRSVSMNIDSNEMLFIGIENKQLIVNLEEKLGYVPSAIDVTIDVDAGQHVDVHLTDKHFNKGVCLSLGSLRQL